MANLEIRRVTTSSGSDDPSIYKGSAVPPWSGSWSTRSTWYDDDTNSWFYNITPNNNFYSQYGKDQVGWASTRFFRQSLTILNQVTNSNGSIDATVRIIPYYFKSRPVSTPGDGVRVSYDVYIGTTKVYDYNGNTRDVIDLGREDEIEINVHLDPEETYQGTAFRIIVTYPNGEFDNSTIRTGFTLYNPNPPVYVPMAIRKSGTWKDLDTNNGKIKRRVSGSWVDKSEESTATIRDVNTGKNRIRKSSVWRQLPPMRGSNPQ